jgi:shikimate kinase
MLPAARPMSSHPSSPAGPIVSRILEAIDPRLRSELEAELARRAHAPPSWSLPPESRIALVGHRAAGKTRLLPLVAALAGRPAFDLDRELEAHHHRSLRDWVREDEPSFRQAERARFLALPRACVVAVGGGFLSLHADLLEGHLPLLVPVTFETYRERLLADATRPRLRPDLTPEEEVAQVFRAREAAHARVKTVPLADFLLAFQRGSR